MLKNSHHYLPKFSIFASMFVCRFVTCQNLILASMFVGRVCYLPKLTFWQVCSLVVFVTCQNLHFGKYVRWSCLLLAKIYILASMFVGRVCLSVCYLPKLPFWQVCWLVMFVCLLVCLFVRKFHKISRTTQLIIIKLGHRKALVHDSCKFVGQECRSNN